jgi:excisionase family DNA binding protein
MKNEVINPRLISVQECGQYLGISPVTIYKSISRKAKYKFPIKPIRIGGLVKFDRRELDAFIEKNSK